MIVVKNIDYLKIKSSLHLFISNTLKYADRKYSFKLRINGALLKDRYFRQDAPINA